MGRLMKYRVGWPDINIGDRVRLTEAMTYDCQFESYTKCKGCPYSSEQEYIVRAIIQSVKRIRVKGDEKIECSRPHQMSNMENFELIKYKWEDL